MLAPVEKQFWLRAEHNIAVREATAEAVAEAGPRFEHPADSWKGHKERQEYAAEQAKLATAKAAAAPIASYLGSIDLGADNDLGEADGELDDGDFALVLLATALKDPRFDSYEAKDWRRFLRAIVRQLHIDSDAYVDEERAAVWLARSVRKRDEIAAAKDTSTPAAGNVFLLLPRDEKDTLK
jgi:hypothetical protein